MARELRETRLPGVGVKYTCFTAHGGRLTGPGDRPPARGRATPQCCSSGAIVRPASLSCSQ